MTLEQRDTERGVAQEVHNAEDVRQKLLRQTQELEESLAHFRRSLEAAPPQPKTIVRKQHGRWRLWKR